MPSDPRRLRLPLVLLLALAAVGAGCGSGDDAATTASSGAAAKPATVSVALDWTPNTNHTGLYVADALGFYREQGIRLKLIPYATTAPETLVSRGRADFGVSYQAGVAYARAAGADVRAVFAPVQKNTFAIGVAADRKDIRSPKDLDGRTYAGFGTPDEVPALQAVIRADGGTGDFRNVTLNTAAYDALRAGRADFTIPVVTWQGVEAQLVGKPMKTFRFEDYGFPEQYSTLLASSDAFLRREPDLTRRFVAATQQGYAYADAEPRRAAQILLDANPKTLKRPELVYRSEALLAREGYRRGAGGRIGEQSAERWAAYGGFLYANGLLAGEDGKPLKAEPDWPDYFTNAYLPKAGG